MASRRRATLSGNTSLISTFFSFNYCATGAENARKEMENTSKYNYWLPVERSMKLENVAINDILPLMAARLGAIANVKICILYCVFYIVSYRPILFIFIFYQSSFLAATIINVCLGASRHSGVISMVSFTLIMRRHLIQLAPAPFTSFHLAKFG